MGHLEHSVAGLIRFRAGPTKERKGRGGAGPWERGRVPGRGSRERRRIRRPSGTGRTPPPTPTEGHGPRWKEAGVGGVPPLEGAMGM